MRGKRLRFGNRAFHHELFVAGQHDARADVVAEVDDLLQRSRQTASGVPVDCMLRRADLHPFRPQRCGDRFAVSYRLDERAVDPGIACRHADGAAGLGVGLQAAIETIVLADEPGDEGILRVFIHLLRRIELLDLAAVKHRDAIRHRQRLRLVVRDVDHGHAEPLMQPPDLELHLLAQLLVERAERLVHQDQLRLEHQGAGHCDALLLATGELRRPPLAEAAELHHVQRALDTLGDVRSRARRAPIAGSRCSRRRSCAGRARSSGTPCRCGVDTAERATAACLRAGSRRRSASRTPRGASASSSCPIPKAQAVSGTRRARYRDRARQLRGSRHRRSCRADKTNDWIGGACMFPPIGAHPVPDLAIARRSGVCSIGPPTLFTPDPFPSPWPRCRRAPCRNIPSSRRSRRR